MRCMPSFYSKRAVSIQKRAVSLIWNLHTTVQILNWPFHIIFQLNIGLLSHKGSIQKHFPLRKKKFQLLCISFPLKVSYTPVHDTPGFTKTHPLPPLHNAEQLCLNFTPAPKVGPGSSQPIPLSKWLIWLDKPRPVRTGYFPGPNGWFKNVPFRAKLKILLGTLKPRTLKFRWCGRWI